MAADLHKEVLATIGQIEVVIDRLVVLQQVLIDLPAGGNPVYDEEYIEVKGNLSFQLGVTMGQLNNLDEAGGR